ncbi:hypothetical protein [Streptomyces abikoensis]|uniref:hypothetical protein n=1 Tax=Streptomyces abikoensis TaxID=97398 RepID=UPI00167A398E|nr:hypothetical protein [Streptomyces abikoensis]GGP55607.1 hypothetical protein GCM10010214_31000 [Streptomyces abikoensis]
MTEISLLEFLKANPAGVDSAGARAAVENPLLMTVLAVAVPLHMMKLRQLSSPQLAAIGRQCAETITSQGDVLQYGGEGCAAAFNALARALAALALTADGGVMFGGAHWCRKPGCRDLDGDHRPRYTDLALPDYREEAS